ncbi:CotH protein [Bythopirellula goksoeyrii]|uniref:CotH protein n=1 Tax=Bythopirellula goksoeyrii TaxID=1400387 RepID=A0A5B9QDR0_9BACT|nr:CotH protein [Bythopirellula goksoeyrii]
MNYNRQTKGKSLKTWLPGISRSSRSRKSTVRGGSSNSLRFEQLEERLALTVVINEFLSDNEDGHRDNAGHRHDWIELKNTGVVAENIAGWYLTDDSGDLTKFQIPSAGALTTLDPGEILLVYASGSNGEVGLVGGEIHTNFQLSQEPGFLALVQSNGSTIEDQYNFYPQQFADISYGLGVGVGSTTTETLLGGGTSSTGDGSPAQFRRFTGPNASIDDHWTEIDYVATGGDGWSNTTNGLGFGYGSPWQDSTVSLGGEISAYVRMPFSVANKAELASMNLDLRVDNGYILFLNGREVQRERVTTDLKIGNDWELNSRQNISNSTITGSPSEIDLTAWLDTIEEGNNVLAIYAANHTSDSGDFLVHAELTAERANGAIADTFMVTPTPGLENGAGYLGIVEDTNFSHDRGFYDAPFPLTISTLEPGTTIRYTTDGTRPTLTNGITYTTPITIDPATLSHSDAGVVMVRAAAFKTGYFATNVDTQSYIFLDEVLNQDGSGLPTFSDWGHSSDPDWEIDQSIVSAVGADNLKEDLKSIPTMSLVMDWEELFGNGTSSDGHGIYTQTDGWRDRSDERFASLEYFTEGLTEEFQIDAVVEIQGHSSANRWNEDKLSFQVKFKQPYDTRLQSETLFGNSAVDGQNAATAFDTLILDAQHNYSFTHANTSVQSRYATIIHDQVVADLSNLAGSEAPHGRWVHLYINGMYWGIYNAHERPDDSFAEEYYGGDKDDYLVVKGFDGINMSHGGTHEKFLQVDGGLTAENAYRDLLNTVGGNMSNLAEYQQVENILDIDSFIDYMVVLYYAGNYDWGENNWFASFDSVAPSGQWHFHSWDQEHAFPNNQNAGAGDSRNQDYDHTLQVAGDFGEHQYGPTGIHHMLMSSQEYRLRFSDRVEELMQNDGVLTPARAQSVWQARVDELSDAINGEAARWGDNRSPDKDGDTWATNVQYTSDHFFFANGSYQSRTDEMIDIFNNTSGSGVGKTDWLVNLESPDFNQFGGTVTTPFNLTMTNPNGGGTIYYTLDGTDPRTAGGGISASALVYSGTVSLTDSTQVRARVRDTSQSGTANDWSAEVNKTFNKDEPLTLRIVELMYNPATAGDLEYIELLNTGASIIDLTGVQLADFSSGGYTFAGGTLAAGERIVVAQDVAAFQSQYPLVTNVEASPFSGSLSNSGETVTLKDSFGVVIQSFAYSDDGLAGWPTTPDGGGRSLEYVGPLNAGENPLDGAPGDPFEVASNWQASAQNGGSPGVDGNTVEDADFDDDTSVSGSDFLVWQRNIGRTSGVSNSTGDANGDSQVNGTDLTIWQAQYGSTVPVALTTTSSLVAESETSQLQPITASSQLTGVTGLYYSSGTSNSADKDAIFADETIELLFVDSAIELPGQVAGSEQSAHDEALSIFGTQDSDQDPAEEEVLTLLAEHAIGFAG